MKIRDRVGDIFETEIKDLAYDGKSVGSNNGKIVFLNAGLPGEIVRAEIIRTKSRFSVGRVQEIMKKSDDRIKPECEHFEICGGCTWQDLDYEKQLYYKRKQVIDSLEHIGKLSEITVDEIIPCQEIFYYRNKMEYSFNVLDDSFTLGLHHRGRYDKIFNVHQCLLQSSVSNKIIKTVRDFTRENKIPVYDVNEHCGFMRFLMIREGKNSNEVMINIVTADGAIPKVEELIDRLVNEYPSIKTIVQENINNQKSNIAKGEKENILYGNGWIEESILNNRFMIYANSFFQTNSLQSEKLYTKAFEFLEPDRGDVLIDLYCGTGTIGICASDNVAKVTGIEIELSSVKAAEENAGINCKKNIDFISGSVQHILKERPELFKEATCAVVDPPRAGLHPKALKRLIELDLKKIVYISCNPATFARDAAKLTDAGYKINRVVPVDMFPHTMHIELTAGFYK